MKTVHQTPTSVTDQTELIRSLIERNDRLMKRNEELEARVAELTARVECLLNENAMLREENQQLRDEIANLKGQKGKPKIPPSILEGPNRKDKKTNESRGKYPRQRKTKGLAIHSRQRIRPDDLPEGAIFKGLRPYTVQDLTFASHNTKYELEQWLLPKGGYVTGRLPSEISGHFGPELKAFILHQHYCCRVTAPLILDQLRDLGVHISSGQLSDVLLEGHDRFHEEKQELLPAGVQATDQIKVDDTGGRHRGKNGYSTVLGNEYFTYVKSSNSKSRINFLGILQGGEIGYLVNEDTVSYIETLKSDSWLAGYMEIHSTPQPMNQQEWETFLKELNITNADEMKLVTEAALFAKAIDNGIPRDLGVHGDDAGQFDAFVRSLCWIHEERHYRKIILATEKARQELEEIRNGLWSLYAGLKAYKANPTEDQKKALEDQFDQLFSKEVSSPVLTDRLGKTRQKKEELLRVLERPSTPLHNNATETDVREMVVKRKISGGTRSDKGRECRDTFISLKKTCRKLNLSFFDFLLDRVKQAHQIPRLAQIIARQCSVQPEGP